MKLPYEITLFKLLLLTEENFSSNKNLLTASPQEREREE